MDIYYVPCSIVNAGVTMANGKSPTELWLAGDKSVHRDTNQIIPDPDKHCDGNRELPGSSHVFVPMQEAVSCLEMISSVVSLLGIPPKFEDGQACGDLP